MLGQKNIDIFMCFMLCFSDIEDTVCPIRASRQK